MERKYGNLTTEIMDMCHSEKDNHIVLRQIAWNLAYIADELAELNRVNSKTIGEIVEDLEMHGIKPEPEKEDAATGLEAEVKTESDIFNGTCFICWNPVDPKNVGGVIIDGDGHTYRACAKCKQRFAVMTDRLVMLPNSIFC